MKKLLLVVAAMFVFAAVNAQDAPKTEKQPSKEDRQKMKEKQEADLNEAFKEIGLTEEQIQKVKAVMDEAGKKNSEVRKNASLTDDQKKDQIKENNEEKNKQLKEIMGDEKYKEFNAVRKRQKDAADMNAPKAAGN